MNLSDRRSGKIIEFDETYLVIRWDSGALGLIARRPKFAIIDPRDQSL